MKVRVSALSHVGKKRKSNEDSYLVDKGLKLFVVCDGMGGHNAGEIASSVAVRVVREAVLAAKSELPRLAEGDKSDRQKLRKLLKNAVRRANYKIYKRSQTQKELRGMGTTLTLLLLAGSRGFVAHVGDSRLYLYRNDHVHQITTDHSLVNEMVRAGRLEPEEVERVPFTNALTRAVGVYPNVQVDTLELDLLPGDCFILCSDGLHNYLSDESLTEGLGIDYEQRSQWFVDFANDAGGKDNITVVLVAVDEVGDKIKTARLRLTLDTLRQIPLFSHLTYAELVRVINVSRAREVNDGDTIINEGDDGDAFYIVLEGSVRVELGGESVATLDAGRHFGEMSLVDNQPRSATVVANETSTLIRIVRKDFYDLLRQDSVTAVKLLWNFIQTLTTRLRTQNVERTGPQLPPPTQTDEDIALDDTAELITKAKSYAYEAFAQTDPSISLPDNPLEANRLGLDTTLDDK